MKKKYYNIITSGHRAFNGDFVTRGLRTEEETFPKWIGYEQYVGQADEDLVAEYKKVSSKEKELREKLLSQLGEEEK